MSLQVAKKSTDNFGQKKANFGNNSVNFPKHNLDTYTIKLIAMLDCQNKQYNGQTKRKFSSEIFLCNGCHIPQIVMRFRALPVTIGTKWWRHMP
jgi:hypothetical protein